MRIPTLAATLRGIAADGPAYIYRGDFARRLSAHVQRYGGWITPEDMASHTSTWDEPIAAEYRGVTLYECPPNGQGLAAILAVNLAAGCDLGSMDVVERVHTMIECMRIAFTDARQWVSDPCAVPLPFEKLCSRAYADRRRREIRGARAANEIPYGNPFADSETVYLSAVDGDGTPAVSSTASTWAPVRDWSCRAQVLPSRTVVRCSGSILSTPTRWRLANDCIIPSSRR
ncbi:MAG: gamma-glutamyltransferase [Ardenticatenaceae bacterium]|nr:gamma-glutamyltransferase [Ardenticatenaceae bacterium]